MEKEHEVTLTFNFTGEDIPIEQIKQQFIETMDRNGFGGKHWTIKELNVFKYQ